MRLSIQFACACALVLSGCANNATPSATASRDEGVKAYKAETKEIWKTRTRFVHNDNTYNIATNPENTYALIAPSGSFAFGPADLEQAVQAYTNCQTDFELGILTSLGGTKSNLNFQDIKVTTGGVRAHRVELSC
jgi:hypothetical protein